MSMLAAPDLGRVLADPDQIDQVILNLVVNARDAMPAGGKLTLETANVTLDEAYARAHLDATAGPHVMLAVSDTGTGMSRSVLERIFEPFFTTKEAGKGTGLGLSTVYGIVRQSGGFIQVDSDLGNGTTFRIYFPRAEPAGGATAGSMLPPALGGTETILLVEDNAAVRASTSALLKRQGYHVLPAATAHEAVVWCVEFSGVIDLLLTDLVMPDGGGAQLSERLQAIRPELTTIFMSGYTDDTAARHGVARGGAEFIQKPITLDALALKVRRVLDGARLATARAR